MKKLINRISSLAAVAALLFAAGCADTYVEEYVAQAPRIESFSPASALSGDDTPIVVTGQHLQSVTSARIGGVEVRILERVSNTRMTIVATKDARSGKITVANTLGTATSEADFTINYPVPVINTDELPEKADMFGRLTLKGQYMAVIRKVVITGADAAQGEGREAEIISQDGAEVVVRVPYVSSETARITLTYMEADREVETPFETAPSIGVVRLVPRLDEPVFQNLIVGRITELTGENLDQITAVRLAGVKANIAGQTSSSLRFTVPMVEGFTEGTGNRATLTIDYFADFESAVVREEIPATVPGFNIWEGITTHAQRGDEAQSFFSPETGLVYSNDLWRGTLDPVSYDNRSSKGSCSAAQTPKVSEAEYNSVVPYFFFSGANAGTLAINSPANSASQLRNFYTQKPYSGNDNRLTGASIDCFGTPVLRFRYLNPGNAAELAVIEKVKNLTIERIDEAEFPIDLAAQTVGGILPGSDAKGGLPTTEWAPDYVSGTDAADFKTDAVLLVLYYNHNGSPSSSNPVENVRRIGFVHITSVDFKVVSSGSNNPPSGSAVHFNVYWQKQDYDYSKL